DQERLGLRVESMVPGFQADLERLLIELRQFGPRVGDEDVERAESTPDLAEHALDVLDARDVSLDQEAICTVLADAIERLLRRGLVRVVVDGDVGAALGELERDAPADST